ncbi:MAG: PspA/IM30 family protein [Myxococcota bacterium]
MSLFSRMSTLIKSNINSMISKAEDPQKILEQLIIDMRSQFLEARKQVATAIADEKRLKRQYEKELQQAKEWETKAMTAVRAGRDDLARQALAKKNEHEGLSTQYQEQWMAQKQAADQLRDSLTQLNSKIQEAQRKKNLLIARQKRAEAQKHIHDTMSGMSDTSAFDTFARMEGKVDQIEAEAEASTELSGAAEPSLEQEFAALESSAPAQDDALSALKAKMGVPAAALPEETAEKPQEVESSTSDEDIEAELEALLEEEKK